MNCDETLSVCEHGRPSKFGCSKCYFEGIDWENLEEKLEMLESGFSTFRSGINKTLEKLQQQFISQKLQLDILHQYKVRQIDENRKISKRVDELQNDHAKIINECVDRLYDIDKCKCCEGKGIVWS